MTTNAIWPYFHRQGTNYYVGECSCQKCQDVMDSFVHTVVENHGGKGRCYPYCNKCIESAIRYHPRIAILSLAVIVDVAPAGAFPIVLDVIPESVSSRRNVNLVDAPTLYHKSHKDPAAYLSLEGAQIGQQIADAIRPRRLVRALIEEVF